MAKKNKTEIYLVSARIVLETNVEVSAESLEDALQQSGSLKIDDFITINGDHIDSKTEITGVNSPFRSLD